MTIYNTTLNRYTTTQNPCCWVHNMSPSVC